MAIFETETRISARAKTAERAKSVAYVVTEDWYFVLHWLPIARVARDMGFEVTVITRVSTLRSRIADEGFRVIDWTSERATLNPRRTIRAMRGLIDILRNVKPSIVHNISLQCTVVGSIAAAISDCRCTINSINGFGYLAAGGRRNRVILDMMLSFVRFTSHYDRESTFTIVPNQHDLSVLVKQPWRDSGNIMLIPGIGVDTERFYPQPDDPSHVTVAFVGRLVQEKGVFNFIEAARLVKERYPETRFIIAGHIDIESPGAVSEETLQQWVYEGIVEWLGFVDDVVEVWRQAQIAVLPSYYGEGLPCSLLEAASCGRSMVTTDVAGCRDVVRDGVDGFVVPPRNPASLAEAICRLVGNRELRMRFGEAARVRVEDVYSIKAVHKQFQRIYNLAELATQI